jgi:hypothetical protein
LVPQHQSRRNGSSPSSGGAFPPVQARRLWSWILRELCLKSLKLLDGTEDDFGIVGAQQISNTGYGSGKCLVEKLLFGC